MNEDEAWETYYKDIPEDYDLIVAKDAFIRGFRAAQPKNKFIVTLHIDADTDLTTQAILNNISSSIYNYCRGIIVKDMSTIKEIQE